MSVPGTFPVYDASNSHVFEEGVERESAANKDHFSQEQLGLLIIFPAVFIFLVYIFLTSDFPLWQVLALIAFLSAAQVMMVVVAVRTYRRPRIHPVQITSDGALVLGPGRWELRSVATIESSGRYLSFRDRNGKRLLTVNDFQVGDLKSFVAAVSRAAPWIDSRADSETPGPHLVRMRKT